MLDATNWKTWIIRGVLVAWGLQVIWLGFHFAPEGRDLVRRIDQRDVGGAIRQEDPLYPWLRSLAAVIPEHGTYVFLDDYQAGKEIEARYFLTPRRHLLLSPRVPADFLFYVLHQEKASFLIIRDTGKPLGPGAQAARRSPACHPVDLPGPGLVFQVDYRLLRWGFYD
jgi:hypothetical protein